MAERGAVYRLRRRVGFGSEPGAAGTLAPPTLGALDDGLRAMLER